MYTVQRKKEVSAITEYLEKNDWCAIVAPSLSGKTTLAGQLEVRLKEKHPAWHVVRIAFEQAGTIEAAWQQIQSGFEQASTLLTVPELSDAKQIAEELSRLVASIEKGRLCLILDNLDALPDEVVFLIAGQLRMFKNDMQYQSARERFSCILFGAVSLYNLVRSEYSALTNSVEVVNLSDFSKEQLAELLRRKYPHAEYPQDALDAFYDETAGHPYLVSALRKQLANAKAGFTRDQVEAAAIEWAENPIRHKKRYRAHERHPSEAREDNSDQCFSNAVKYLENNKQAFYAVLNLLEKEPSSVLPGQEPTPMCGALRLDKKKKEYSFRGRMFERAFSNYLDALRRADYCALHGDWEKARRYYGKTELCEIRARRRVGFGETKHRIMDLFLGLVPIHQKAAGLKQVEKDVTETVHRLFGASSTRLWRCEVDAPGPQIVHTIGDPLSKNLEELIDSLVQSSIRNQKALTLENNLGVVRGIGNISDSICWAIEIYYDTGLPGNWVHDNLYYLDSCLYGVLSQIYNKEWEQKRTTELSRWLHDLSCRLQTATRVSEVLDRIVDGVTRVLGYECAQLSLLFPEEQQIRAVKSTGAFIKIKEETTRRLDSDDALVTVVRTGTPKNIGNCQNPNEHCDPEAIQHAKLRSQVIVPLLQNTKGVGALQVGSTTKENAFSKNDLLRIQLLADEAAIALKMAGEREALELALEATGNATVVFDATESITTCNNAYRRLHQVEPGDPAPLTQVGEGQRKESLAKAAFAHEKKVLQSFHPVEGHRYIATAASRANLLGGYGGGIEVIGTRSPLYGLTESVSRMLACTGENQLGQTIVDSLRDHLGYARVRLYKSDSAGHYLSSRWCAGMSPKLEAKFKRGEYSHRRTKDNSIKNDFACLDAKKTLVVVRPEYAEETLPRGVVDEDSQHRTVFIPQGETIEFDNIFDKEAVYEWMDVPLIHQQRFIGKISIDQKGNNQHFLLEDLELMTLFAQLASQAMARILELEEARVESSIARDVKFLEAAIWNFLLEITTKGVLELNRAVVFLRIPHSTSYRGRLCIGTKDKEAWERLARSVDFPAEGRLAFIENACRERLRGNLSEEEQETIERLKKIVISQDNEWWNAIHQNRENHGIPVARDQEDLQSVCQHLQWETPQQGYIYPLKFQDEYEGLLYVDSAFLDEPLSPENNKLLSILCSHFACVIHAHVHREVEELRNRMLSITHSGVAPMASVRVLLDSLPHIKEEHIALPIRIASAEAQRSVDAVRRALRVGQATSSDLHFDLAEVEPAGLFRERIKAYITLLEQEEVHIDTEGMMEKAPFVQADEQLLGIAFAELAANARTALISYTSAKSQKIFKVASWVAAESNTFQLRIENSVLPDRQINEDIFDLYTSHSGTGLGLWLVRHILTRHGGTVERVNTGNRERFSILLTLPLSTQNA